MESQVSMVGVDTHKAGHSAALLDGLGRVEDVLDVAANRRGYEQLLNWARAQSQELRWVVEGTGSYGAALASFLLERGEVVYEGDRPQRRKHDGQGKSDQLDAIKVAREALAKKHHAIPRQRGRREAIRVLMTSRQSAVDAYCQGLNQLYALVVTAPEALHERLNQLQGERLIRTCLRLHASGDLETEVTVATMRQLARRLSALQAEAEDYAKQLACHVAALAPTLLAEPGVGPISAAQILVSWSHAGRIRNENAFATLAGVAPIKASSGKVVRHRLSRFGDRQLNRALHTVALSRSLNHPETKAYIARRTAEGKSSREIRRCIKRYLSRRFFRLLQRLDNL